MTWYIAVTGLCLFRVGLLTAVDDDGSVEFMSPGAAGCGMAAFLAVMTAQVIS